MRITTSGLELPGEGAIQLSATLDDEALVGDVLDRLAFAFELDPSHLVSPIESETVIGL